MYSMGKFQGREVFRVSDFEYLAYKQNYTNFYICDDRVMYFYGEPVAYVSGNDVRNYDEDKVEALMTKAQTRLVEKLRSKKMETKRTEREVAETRPKKEEEPVVADSETADRILQSWQGKIDGILEGLMSKELVIERAL